VACVNVSCPTRFGSLGSPDLRIFGTTLHLRWLWLVRTDLDRTWVTFLFPIDCTTKALFDASITVEIEDVPRLCFGWTTSSLVALSNTWPQTFGLPPR
jgi:hypothetical protein